MKILFMHGAGGWVDDQLMAAELRQRLGVPATMPRLLSADMSVGAWRADMQRQ